MDLYSLALGRGCLLMLKIATGGTDGPGGGSSISQFGIRRHLSDAIRGSRQRARCFSMMLTDGVRVLRGFESVEDFAQTRNTAKLEEATVPPHDVGNSPKVDSTLPEGALSGTSQPDISITRWC